LAAFGVADPALATTAVTGPGVAPAVTNAATDTDIAVSAGAVVQTDGNGDSIINTGTLTGAASSISVDASTILGNILNSGTLSATGAFDGIALTNGSVVIGGITNTSLIESAAQNGIFLDDVTLIGGITNSGTASQILGVTNAILFSGNSVILAGVTNAGTIAGSTNGIHFGDANVDFIGDITNSATGTISGGAGGAAINMELMNTFVGDIANSGRIAGAGASGMGISLDSGAFTGDITNSATGTIVVSGAADQVAVSLTGGTLTGDLSNAGVILASGATGTALLIDGVTFDGTIINSTTGVISASGASGVAIDMASGDVTGGLSNAGDILAVGAGGVAVQLAGTGEFAGGISNTSAGLISADSTAIVVSIDTFTGNITNSGSIVSDSGAGIVLSGTLFDGGVSNASGAVIDVLSTGIYAAAGSRTITGDVSNAGTILASTGNGIRLAGTLVDGNVTNSGSIVAGAAGILWSGGTITGDVTNSEYISASGNGISLGGTLIGGGVTNDGDINSGAIGIQLGATGTITDDLTNNGTIVANTIGIRIQGLVSGDLVNTGVIDPSIGVSVAGTITGTLDNSGVIEGTTTGILVDGVITGGITNSGTIAGGTTAIDTSGADAAVDITLTAGLIQGGDGGTTVNTAIDMSNGLAETFTADAGTLFGSIVGNATDDVIMGGGGEFAWLAGVGTGFDQFDAVGGTVLLGAGTIGQLDGAGVTVSAVSMAITSSHVYLDDDTFITLSGALDASGGEGVIEWFLTTGTVTGTDYGTITAATGDLDTDTEAAVYLDQEDFATAGMLAESAGTIVYQDVIDTGGLSGAFSNEDTITTSSLFFEGTALEDASNNIDIVISRHSFATVLTDSDTTESANQNSIGLALEEIYLSGTISSDFEDLFASLFTGDLTTDDIKAIYDDLAGAEHAQVHQTSLRTADIFNDIVGQRLDQTLAAQTGMATASLDGQRFAQAAISASDALGRPGDSGLSVWLRGSGQWANVDTDANAAGYDQDNTGVSGGLDYAVSPNATVGVAGHWSTADIDFDTPGDSAEADSWGAGLYGSYGFGRFYADGLFNYASHDVSTVRTIQPPVLNAPFSALAGYDSTTWSVAGELGMMWRLGRVNVQPSVGVTYTDLSTDGFTETGDAGNYLLIVEDADANSFASTLALRASGQWKMGRTQIVPEIKVGWRHEFEDEPMSFNAAWDDPVSPTFTIVSSEVQQDSAVVRAGFTAGVTRNLEVFVNVNGQYNSDASATNASGGLRFTW
jgi:outer membrane autotransporter protein